MNTPFELTNKTILVTGGGTGLGQHFALCVAEAGATVIITGRRVEKLADTTKLIEANGGTVKAYAVDVSDEKSVAEFFEQLATDIDRLDCLINNAGVNVPKTLLDTSLEEWQQVQATNTQGPWLMGKGYLGFLQSKQQQQGNVINIASITGLATQRGLGAYGTSKAAVIHLTELMAVEWARYGVRVNSLVPGYFKTDITEDFLATEAGISMVKKVPLRRFGELDELIGPLFLLCSDASSYMNGTALIVDGGHMMRCLQ